MLASLVPPHALHALAATHGARPGDADRGLGGVVLAEGDVREQLRVVALVGVLGDGLANEDQ